MPISRDPPFGLGSPLRPFRLPEPLTGRLLGPEDFPEARALLVAFICNASPDVQHVAGAFAALTRDFEPLGLRTLAVNATADEPPLAVAAEALRHGYVFPYLIDQTRAVARAYQAVSVPDFYLFDAGRRLAYHGRFDETRFGEGRAAHGGDLRRVIRAALGTATPAEGSSGRATRLA
jgi:hypothetical protein